MKKTSLLLVLSVVSFLLCLVLAAVVCMPVDSDEITGTFEVSVFEPTIAAFLLSIISAICANRYVQKMAEKENKAVNALIMSIGIGLFGLFYGLRTAYSDASDVLSDFYFAWGGSGTSMSHIMPEWADKFQHTADTYTIFIVGSVLIAVFGIYKVYSSIRK